MVQGWIESLLDQNPPVFPGLVFTITLEKSYNFEKAGKTTASKVFLSLSKKSFMRRSYKLPLFTNALNMKIIKIRLNFIACFL
jgi:hypothetical protein